MARYDFLDVKTREIVELVFDWKEVPAIGKTIQRGGRRLRRIITPAGYQVGANAGATSTIVAKSMPRFEKDHKGHWQRPADEPDYPTPTPDGKTDVHGVTVGPRGEPCFDSVKSREEFLAKGEKKYAYGVD